MTLSMQTKLAAANAAASSARASPPAMGAALDGAEEDILGVYVGTARGPGRDGAVVYNSKVYP
jgi:hypothetical protein